jgi:hypothetical protein
MIGLWFIHVPPLKLKFTSEGRRDDVIHGQEILDVGAGMF